MAPLLKDQLFNADTVGLLADGFERAGVFAAQPFVDAVLQRFPPLELKARIAAIADVLADYLPADYAQAADAITAALPPPLDPTLGDDDFGHFVFAALGVYAENHGTGDHHDRSLDLLEAVTQRFSMEFSIRAFINADPGRTLARLAQWTGHDHYHVRRLVSEGTRPKLPWGQGIVLGPDQTLPLLDKLQADRTRFVTRSVANHLNDITKSDPGVVLDRLKNWQSKATQTPKEIDWMQRHALRGLVKAGHPGALELLGFHADVALDVATISMSPEQLCIGDTADIAVTVQAQQPTPLIIDYVIDFVKANGRHAPRVFKLKQVKLKAGAAVTVRKRHHFKADATTFTHYPGPHRIYLQINGRKVAQTGFVLS